MATRTSGGWAGTRERSSRPFYSRVVVVGLVGFIISVLVLGAGVVLDEPADGVFAIVFAGVAAVVAFAVARAGRWALYLAIVAGLAGFALTGPFIATSITSPDSFFEFTSTIIGVPSLLLVVVGAIVALVQYRRESCRTQATALETNLFRGGAAALTVVAAISAVLTVTGMDSVSAADRQGAVVVRMEKTSFPDEMINVKANSANKLVVENEDAFSHTFTVDDLDIDVKFGPGDEKLIRVEGAAPGSYEFRCTLVGHESMEGMLIVE